MQKTNISKSELIQIKLKELEILKSTTKFWNISKEQADFLSKIVLEKKPTTVLEIETSNGYSTIYLTKNLNENSIITTIEVDETRYEIAKKNFMECNLTNIIQIKGEILEILNSDKLNGNKYDFLFLDAMQREYLNIIKLLENKNLLTKNITIVADNVLSHGNMKEFIEYMQKNYNTEIFDLDGGFLVSSNK